MKCGRRASLLSVSRTAHQLTALVAVSSRCRGGANWRVTGESRTQSRRSRRSFPARADTIALGHRHCLSIHLRYIQLSWSNSASLTYPLRLLLQLLERQTISAVNQNPALRDQVNQLILPSHKAAAQQKHLEETCSLLLCR